MSDLLGRQRKAGCLGCLGGLVVVAMLVWPIQQLQPVFGWSDAETSRLELAWCGLLAVGVALVGGFAGYYIKASQSAPANPDQALANDLAAAWSTTYDTAKVVPLYASNATFHDMIVNETTTGLANIQAKVSTYIAQGFTVTNTSAPIREGDFVAWFGTYESAGQSAAPVLNVVSLSDGKIVDQWVYPAP